MKQTYEVDKGDCKVIVENEKEVGRNNRILGNKGRSTFRKLIILESKCHSLANYA